MKSPSAAGPAAWRRHTTTRRPLQVSGREGELRLLMAVVGGHAVCGDRRAGGGGDGHPRSRLPHLERPGRSTQQHSECSRPGLRPAHEGDTAAHGPRPGQVGAGDLRPHAEGDVRIAVRHRGGRRWTGAMPTVPGRRCAASSRSCLRRFCRASRASGPRYGVTPASRTRVSLLKDSLVTRRRVQSRTAPGPGYRATIGTRPVAQAAPKASALPRPVCRPMVWEAVPRSAAVPRTAAARPSARLKARARSMPTLARSAAWDQTQLLVPGPLCGGLARSLGRHVNSRQREREAGHPALTAGRGRYVRSAVPARTPATRLR